MEYQHNVCGIMVTYNPEETVLSNIVRSLDEIGNLLIVDNGSTNSFGRKIESYLAELKDAPTHRHHNVEIIKNGHNLGLPAALNIALKRAKTAGYEFILLLDQDSFIEPHTVSGLLNGFMNLKSRRIDVGILVPKYLSAQDGESSWDSGDSFQRIKIWYCNRMGAFRDDLYQEIFFTIGSGMFMKIDTILHIGGFRSGFFLDNYDEELCFRLRRNGLKIIMNSDGRIWNYCGNPVRIEKKGKVRVKFIHTPLRTYYIVRNDLYIVKDYITSFPFDIVVYFLVVLYSLWSDFITNNQKLKMLKAIVRAVTDFMKGVQGELNNSNLL